MNLFVESTINTYLSTFILEKGKGTMVQEEKLSEILTEISRLKEQLNKIYDSNNHINGEMLEVSTQLDQKINVYLEIKMKKQFLPEIKK